MGWRPAGDVPVVFGTVTMVSFSLASAAVLACYGLSASGAMTPVSRGPRGPRGLNVQSVAVAGPPIQLSQSEYNTGYGAKVAVLAESPATNDDEDDEEEEGLRGPRGGVMWTLARLLLWGYLVMLAGALAVCFATQLGALCNGCKQLCCFCVQRKNKTAENKQRKSNSHVLAQENGSETQQKSKESRPHPSRKGLELRELYSPGRRAPGGKKHSREKAHRFPDTALCISGTSSEEEVLYDKRRRP